MHRIILLLLFPSLVFSESTTINDHENIYELMGKKLDQIEVEMKKIGMWDVDVDQDQTKPTSAFGQAENLAFEQWLRHVFIPNSRKIVQTRGELPNRS